VLIFALTGPILLASIGGGIWLEMRMFGYPAQEGQPVDPFAEMLEPSGEIPQPAHQRRLSQCSNIPARNLARERRDAGHGFIARVKDENAGARCARFDELGTHAISPWLLARPGGCLAQAGPLQPGGGTCASAARLAAYLPAMRSGRGR
jgi:hypothetical protein